jgi:hypothetical protein
MFLEQMLHRQATKPQGITAPHGSGHRKGRKRQDERERRIELLQHQTIVVLTSFGTQPSSSIASKVRSAPFQLPIF